MKSNFKVSGMHCRACELIIKEKLKDELGEEEVTASYKTGEVLLDSHKEISTEKLNKLFEKDGYRFSQFTQHKIKNSKHDTLLSIGIAVIIAALFMFLGRLGFASNFQVSSTTALGGFLIFGLLAGSSTCAALVGGLILSMTKRWSKQNTSPLTVNLLFNVGRIVAYTMFGFILGSVGSLLQFSASTTFLITIAVVIVMVAMGLNMLGLNILNSLIPNSPTIKSLPKSFSKLGPLEPLALGAITLFLPCGFTFATQTAAVATGDPIKGSLMLGIFALGTAPVLLMIGLTSQKAVANPRYASIASKSAGILVILFAFQMINSQLNSIGVGGINTVLPASTNITAQSISDGQQLIEVSVYANRFEPAVITLKTGVPAVFNITDKGMTGCTSAIKAPGLFNDTVTLIPKETISKTFTPTKTGRYILSCWMGMVTSTINVIDAN